MLPQALGNAEDGVPSAFPGGKQNEAFILKLYHVYRNYMKFRKNDKTKNCFKYFVQFFILFTLN